MRVIVLGPPGSGKGSLASHCERRLGVRHISTGQIFREQLARRTALGRRVARYVTSGRLVPDALVVAVMRARLGARRLAEAFILDGFPRTLSQARGLDGILQAHRRALDGVIYLEAPQAVLIRRLSGRRVCGRCGANYHLRTRRPRRPGRCDACGGVLSVRKDDEPRTIRRRLAIDRRAARPLVRHYRRGGLLHRLNGRGSIDAVFGRTVRLFRREGWLARGRHD